MYGIRHSLIAIMFASLLFGPSATPVTMARPGLEVVQDAWGWQTGFSHAGGVAPSSSHLSAADQQGVIHVPQGVNDLQQAIYLVGNGGIIELAGGTYPSPAGGFRINDLGKDFTIRAAAGATVVLDGGGSRDIVRFINSDVSKSGVVTFQAIEFSNGWSETNGIAGGLTMQRAKATFIDCSFRNNWGKQSTPGGGVLVAINSVASFTGCVWDSNTATNFGGGLAVEEQSQVSISNSQFIANRTNPPGHLPVAAGGGIHVGNSTLQIADTQFVNNEAGYAGGAIYAVGTWADPVSTPRAVVSVSNCTFTANRSARDPSVSFPCPTEGGALHTEDQTSAWIYNSRFAGNSAMVGGAMAMWRSCVTISGSIFQDNSATGVGPATGFGGAISAVSNDIPSDGNVNRRTAQLTVRDTLISAQYPVGQAGGGLYVAGDGNRTYGINGVSQMGTAADNRAIVYLSHVIFANTDVQETAGSPGTGVGGALMVDLADLTMQNCLVILADAFGQNNSAGGGLAIINNSVANITEVAIARCTAGKYGGGVFVQGSTVHLNRCHLFENQITGQDLRYGAAMFSAPDRYRNSPAAGAMENCALSDNIGMTLFDDDGQAWPINDVRYNGNQIYGTTFGDKIYQNSITGYYNVAGLNSLIVTHQGVPNTPKSQSPNSSARQTPIAGAIIAVPNFVLSETSPYLLIYGWSGGLATLDGVPVSQDSAGAGLKETTGSGVHTLLVSGVPFTVEVRKLSQRVYMPLIIKQ